MADKPPGSMDDGKYPITDEESLKSAIKLVGRSTTHSTEEVKEHIKRRAKALGLTRLLPDDWVTQEASVGLRVPLTMEAVGVKPQIVQEATAENNHVMRVRVPFYVGGSITESPTLPGRKILFQEKLLPTIVQEGNAAISASRPPLTVYARHSHAISGDGLPIGKVVGLEQEGRVGYATLELLDVKPHGAHVQALITHEMLDSVSLRANPGGAVLTQGRVNGKSMLVCERLALAGIDMAPDGPAQETYGIEVLQEAAVIEPVQPEERRTKLDEPLTLERVRVEAPHVIEDVERPLKEKLATITQERDALVLEKNVRERDAVIQGYAAKTNDPEKFAQIVTTECETRGIKGADGVHAMVAPHLLQEVETLRQTGGTATPTTDEQIKGLFRVGGAGQVTEPSTLPTEPAAAALTQEQANFRATADGGMIPEDF